MKSIHFVFWNICNKPQNIPIILQFAKDHDVDVVMLCEVKEPETQDTLGYTLLDRIDEQSNGIAVYAKPNISLFCARERSRFNIYRIPAPINISFAVAHLNSYRTVEHKRFHASTIKTIKEDLLTEAVKYHDSNCFVVGDINENLFEDYMVNPEGFNVRFFKFQTKAKKEKRHEQDFDIFYNPMLNLYKDYDDPSVAKGTHYYRNNSIGWLCYDQVLIKPDLVDCFDLERLKIVSSFSNEHSLVKNHKPNKKYSDHLPIMFTFHYKEEEL